MKEEHKFLTAVLLKVLGDRRPLKELSAEMLEKVRKLAKEQYLEGIFLETCRKQKSLGAKQREEWMRREMIVIQRSCQLDAVYEEIDFCLQKTGIDWIPVKGIVMKHRYPLPKLREMGDIDLVIREEDRQAVKTILREHGFLPEDQQSHVFGMTVWKDTVKVEIHWKLFEELISRRPEVYEKCLSTQLWEHAVLQSGSRYELPLEEEFLLLLLHMAGHFYYQGCGIRFFYDLAVFYAREGEKMDMSSVYQKMQDLQLLKFAETICSVVNHYFKTEIPIRSAAKRRLPPIELEYLIWTRGAFGEPDNYTEKILRQERECKLEKHSSYSLVWSAFWISKKEWQQRYPYLKQKEWLFLAAIVQRLLHTLQKYGLWMFHIKRDKTQGQRMAGVPKKLGLE